jgi:hypothetical protein
VIAIEILDFGILVLMFLRVKINFIAGLCADDSTASSQPVYY